MEKNKEHICPKCDKKMKNHYRSLHNKKYCIGNHKSD